MQASFNGIKERMRDDRATFSHPDIRFDKFEKCLIVDYQLVCERQS
jgi:hypothetical protein